MDWSNERYVRWYTRDTKTWMMLGWQGQAVLGFLMRKVDRSGMLDDVQDGADLSVIFSNGMPIEDIQRGLDRLTQKGVVKLTESGLLIVNFLEAQEASKSDALRQKESRDRRRAGFMKHPSDRSGQVYFIQSENGGPIKIGFASDVRSRISNIQTGRADRIVLLAAIDGTPDLEASLHARFAGHSIGGEWFSPCEELIEMIGREAGDGKVTGRDDIESGRDESSHEVTGCHDLSHPVTPTCALPGSAVPCQTLNLPGDGAPDSSPGPKSRKRKAPAEKFRLPPDWLPSDARLEATQARTGIDRATLLRQVPDFRLYWLPGGKGDVGTKAIKRACDWDTAFANRIDQLIDWGKLTLVVNSPAATHTQPNQPIPGQTKPDGQVYHRDGYWYHPLPNQPKAAE